MIICKHSLIKSKYISILDDIMLVEFPNVSTINNKDCLVLKIDQEFPISSSSLKLNFKINNSVFSVMTLNGNSVRANQIKSHKVYTVYVSTENPIMIMRCYLPSSGITYPNVSAKEKLVS